VQDAKCSGKLAQVSDTELVELVSARLELQHKDDAVREVQVDRLRFYRHQVVLELLLLDEV